MSISICPHRAIPLTSLPSLRYNRRVIDPRFPGMSVFILLVVIALILAVVSLVKPSWPLIPISVILLSVALIISRRGF